MVHTVHVVARLAGQCGGVGGQETTDAQPEVLGEVLVGELGNEGVIRGNYLVLDVG